MFSSIIWWNTAREPGLSPDSICLHHWQRHFLLCITENSYTVCTQNLDSAEKTSSRVLLSLCCWNVNRYSYCTAILWREAEKLIWHHEIESCQRRNVVTGKRKASSNQACSAKGPKLACPFFEVICKFPRENNNLGLKTR